MARFRFPDRFGFPGRLRSDGGDADRRAGLPDPPGSLVWGCRLATIGGVFGTLLGFYFLASSFQGHSFGELSRTEVRVGGVIAMVECIITLLLATAVMRGSYRASRALVIFGVLTIVLSGLSLNLSSLIGALWIGTSSYLVFTGSREWHGRG